MARYLIKARYTAQGAAGLRKEGGSGRKAAVQKLMESAGGRLEAFYFAFGDADVFAIVDVPDAVTAAALSLTIGSAGAVELSSTPLLTVEEVDQACKKSLAYRAPGT